jgi:hypothetical protein
MALELPLGIQKHIKAKDTQLMPLIQIGTYIAGAGGWDYILINMESRDIYGIDRSLPLLLNMPTFKEFHLLIYNYRI